MLISKIRMRSSVQLVLISALCVNQITAMETMLRRRRNVEEEAEELIEEFVTSLPARLDAAELQQPPDVMYQSEPTDTTVIAGESVELKCEASGIPPPIVQWSYRGQFIDQGPHGGEDNTIEKLLNIGLSTIQNGITVSRLHLPCVDRRNAGTYECIAHNGHEVIRSSAVVSVKGHKHSKRCRTATAVSQKKREWRSGEQNDVIVDSGALSIAPSAPKIFMWTDGRFERMGANVQLYCRASGVPTPTITWVYNENETPVTITTGPMFEVLRNGDLLIKDTSDPDRISGSYACVATNEHGEDRVEPFFYPTEYPEKR